MAAIAVRYARIGGANCHSFAGRSATRSSSAWWNRRADCAGNNVAFSQAVTRGRLRSLLLVALLPLFLATPAAAAATDDGTSERAILALALAGDPDALRRLYLAHGPRIRRFLRGMLGDAAAADDATQETFVRAFRRLTTLRDGDRLVPWLFGIARHVANETRRARRRDAGAPLVADRDEAHADTPEALLVGRETEARIGGVLAGLAEDRRAALLLRIDHGLSYDEIAELLGWSVAKAKVEVHRARLVLRERLAGSDAGEEVP